MEKVIKRILIAEDSPEWQKFHKSLLGNYDKHCVEYTFASNARDALKIAIESSCNPFNLVLSDLQMESDFLPEFAGEWFVKNLKNVNEYKNIPIVVISAAYNIAFIASNLGTDYLSKRSLVSNPNAYYFMLDEKL